MVECSWRDASAQLKRIGCKPERCIYAGKRFLSYRSVEAHLQSMTIMRTKEWLKSMRHSNSSLNADFRPDRLPERKRLTVSWRDAKLDQRPRKPPTNLRLRFHVCNSACNIKDAPLLFLPGRPESPTSFHHRVDDVSPTIANCVCSSRSSRDEGLGEPPESPISV